MNDTLERLRQYNLGLLEYDAEMAEREAVVETLESRRPPKSREVLIQEESIVMRRRRPVLAIKGGTTELIFNDKVDIKLWKTRLQAAEAALKPAIRSVGRINLEGHEHAWVGTGWLVDPKYIVTNRHVAELFTQDEGTTFTFQDGVEASIDLLQEIGSTETQVFACKGVRYIEDVSGADIAFLEVDQIAGKDAEPILLAPTPTRDALIATIGYPAFDSRIPNLELMEEIYGSVYNKKRVAPGSVMSVQDTSFQHNCTTLGGSSGSAIIDLKTGLAVGLHFSGTFMTANYAVRSDVLEDRVDRLRKGTLRRRLLQEKVPVSPPSHQPGEPVVALAPSAPHAVTITIPLTITVSLGVPVLGEPVSPTPANVARIDDSPTDLSDDQMMEAPLASYVGRKGYDPSFLDDRVELPLVTRDKSHILHFNDDEFELKYHNFSVVMNEKRRQCFFSACNVNGKRSKSTDRVIWRYDPRIPKDLQIMKECYGDPPKFSRGHMTRREDPAWGTDALAQLGSDDSMHVTNATPQLQSFNSPIWLALEDYALQNARRSKQNISVFTGPYFDDRNDLTLYGVRIPLKFWKVIAFIHEKSGKLCATGYKLSQQKNLEDLKKAKEEFVFGQFVSPQLNVSTQVSLASIEREAGVSFGALTAHDPLGQEGLDAPQRALIAFSQIRFI